MSGIHENLRQIVILHVDAEAQPEPPQQSLNEPFVDAEHISGSTLSWNEMLESATIYCDVLFDFETGDQMPSAIFSQSRPMSGDIAKSPSLDEAQSSDDRMKFRHRELRRNLLDDVQQNVRIKRATAVHHCGFPLRWQVFHVSKRIRSMSLANCHLEILSQDAPATAAPFTNHFTAPVVPQPSFFEWDSSLEEPIHLYAQADMTQAKGIYIESAAAALVNRIASLQIENVEAIDTSDVDDVQTLEATESVVPIVLDFVEKAQPTLSPALGEEARTFEQSINVESEQIETEPSRINDAQSLDTAEIVVPIVPDFVERALPTQCPAQGDQARSFERPIYIESDAAAMLGNRNADSQIGNVEAMETSEINDMQSFDTTETVEPIVPAFVEQAHPTVCPVLGNEVRSFEQLWRANFNETLMAHRFRVDLDHSAIFRSNMELLMKQEMRDINIVLCFLGIVAFGLITMLLSIAYTNALERKHIFSDGRLSSATTKANRSTKDIFIEGFTVGNCSYQDTARHGLLLSPTTNGAISPLSLDSQTAMLSSPCGKPLNSPEPMSPVTKLQANWWGSRATRRQNRNQRMMTPLASPPNAPEATSHQNENTEFCSAVEQWHFFRPISPIMSPNKSIVSECAHQPPELVDGSIMNVCRVTPTTSPISIRSANLEAYPTKGSTAPIDCTTTSLNDQYEYVKSNDDCPDREPMIENGAVISSNDAIRSYTHVGRDRPHSFVEDYW